MAGIIINTQDAEQSNVFGKLQVPIKMFLEKRSEAFEQQSLLPLLFGMDTSTHWGEAYTSQTGFEDFEPVGENGAYPKTDMHDGFTKTFKHMTFKQSFSITKEAVEDAQLQSYKKEPRKFIDAYYRSREKFGAALYAAAFLGNTTMSFGKLKTETFDATAADGLPLLHAQHKAAGRGKKWSNVCSNTISTSAIDAVETAMQNFCDDDGNLLGLTPDTILIRNNPTAKRAAYAAIGSEYNPDNANRAFNYQYGRWNLICNPYIDAILGSDAPNAWAMIDSTYLKDVAGAVWLDRVKLETDSYVDKNTDANVWKGRARWSAGFNDPRFIFGGGISGAAALS